MECFRHELDRVCKLKQKMFVVELLKRVRHFRLSIRKIFVIQRDYHGGDVLEKIAWN